MKKTVKGGYETTVMDSGHKIIVPVQTPIVKKVKDPIDTELMTIKQILKKILVNQGVECK